LCAAAACLGWVAVFLRFASVRRPLIDNLSESAYGIYLVHYLFITWLQYMLLGIALFAVAKAAIVFTGTLVLSWGLTASMRRVPMGNRWSERTVRAFPGKVAPSAVSPISESES
jgi:surface polysaccharide O-acyltransferase-like enzyme